MICYFLVYSCEENYIRVKKEDKEREFGDKGKESKYKYIILVYEIVIIKFIFLY